MVKSTMSPRRVPALLLTAGLALAVSLALSGEAAAQAFGVGANVGQYSLNGDDFEGVESGWGYEAFASLSPGGGGTSGMPGMGLAGGGFDIGVGIKQSTHDVEGTERRLRLRQIFLSPGLNLAPADSRLRLSVRTRGGLGRLSLLEAPGLERLDADGFDIGGSVGVEFFLTRFLALEPSIAASYLNFEDPEAEPDPGAPQLPIPGFGTGERVQGWSLGFRLGLNVLIR